MLSFRSSLLRLRKPSDVCDGLLAHLNIHLEKDVPVADLVPQDPFGERPFLFDTDLGAMLAELDIDNEDAYREVMRQPPLEGRKKPRLAYSRNFYAGLEDMRRYYDTSEDQYYFVKDDEREEKEARQKRERYGKDENNGDAKMTDSDTGPKQAFSVSSSSPNNPDGKAYDLPPSLHPKNGIEYWKQVYKGLRLGNAAALPPPTRTSTVRNLLKMVTHKFDCRDYDVNSKERLKIVDLIIPRGIGSWLVGMYSFAIVKVPADMKMARGRYVEGPVMGVSVRHEAVFKKKPPKSQNTKEQSEDKVKYLEPELARERDALDRQGSAFDFSRELASMLALALQRSREGKNSRDEAHEKESEKWWWTKNERWGGGPTKWGQLACEYYEDEDPSWSSEERKLQFKKRREAEEEMQRFAESDARGNDLNVEDLIASTKENEKPDHGGRSERGPPKKRNKMEIPDRPRRAADNGSKHDNNNSSNTDGRARGGKEKKRKDSEEHHEGRRVMYVAPSRKKFYKEWETIRPNPSMWDEKMIHRRIGRPSPTDAEKGSANGDWDEVFQVTSVNHHVAIMKMRISKRYLHWLETGEAEKREESGEDDILRIWRSEWFDMFDKEARKAWMVGMWRVMCWICRDEVPRQEWEKWETLKGKEEAADQK